MTYRHQRVLHFEYCSFVAVAPAYSNLQKYSKMKLCAYWDMAINYVSDIANFGSLQYAGRQYAINLMTAHLVYISDLIASGTTPYIATSATVDKVAVTLQPPPAKNQFQWWLNTSPYGAELLALLQVNSVGGFYIGGSAQRAAFGFQGGLY